MPRILPPPRTAARQLGQPPGRARPSHQCALALAIALALLLAQGLGLLHRAAHGAAERPAGATEQPSGRAPAPADTQVHGLFDGHSPGSDECRLLDQLTHADALPSVALPAGGEATTEAPLGAVPAARAHRHAANYQARAPPRG